MNMKIRPATDGDLQAVLDLLNSAAEWLHARGVDQWPYGFDERKIGPLVDRREVYVVDDEAAPIATITASQWGDPDFWSPTELAEPATYVNKAAISRRYADQGLGTLLFRWITDRAARQGHRWVRLDAWRTNTALHDYYLRNGWSYVRTEELPWRRSGALFSRPTALDIDAHRAFLLCPPSPIGPSVFHSGQRVMVRTLSGPTPGTITARKGPDLGYSEVSQGWEHSTSLPPANYVVELDDGSAIDVSADTIIGIAYHH